MSRQGRTFTGLNDPRADRNSRLAAAGRDLGPEFERDSEGRLRLRVSDPVVVAKDGRVTVDQTAGGEAADVAQVFVTIGSDLPADPDAGHMHIHSALEYAALVWDLSRSKWLSVHSLDVTFVSQVNVVVGGFMRLFDGPASSGSYGFPMPWAATLTTISSSKDDTTTASRLDLRVGTTIVKSHSVAAADKGTVETGLNVDVAAGDKLNVIVAVGTYTGGGTVTYTFKRRAT